MREKRTAVMWCHREHHDGSKRGAIWVDGYHVWGGLIVKAMRKSKRFAEYAKVMTDAFVTHEILKRPSARGWCAKNLWLYPASYTIGAIRFILGRSK